MPMSWSVLEAIGHLPDIEIDIADAALQLARLETGRGDEPPGDWRETAAHLSELARESARIGDVMRDSSPEARAGAITGLLHGRFAYRGDTDTYDDLANANLIKVVRRRRGLPVALGVLWLHCLRAAGWEAQGIDFPGHFLVSLDPQGGEQRGGSGRGGRLLIDPFGCGRVMNSSALVELLRGIIGAEAVLQPGMVRPMSTRAVLLRLQRNLVQRRLLAHELEGALGSLESMLRIAPDEAGNWLGAADLHQRLGHTEEAISCLERFLVLVPQSEAASLARLQLEALRRS